MSIISGYCKCSFPASIRCQKCGVKLCGNCAKGHECEKEAPELNLSAESQSETVKSAIRKPYGPRVKK